MEELFPKYKNQVILRNEWGLDLFYFCLNHLAISAILIYASYHVSHFNLALSPTLQAYIQSAPILLQVVVIVIATDFVLYWEHRVYQEVKILWPIHAVHHSIGNIDWLINTFHLPGKNWPASYGTTKPLPKNYIGQTLYPITAFKKYNLISKIN